MGEVSGVNGAQSTVQPVQITIKKNQGITQALFDLVKNENLSDGKIDATEWANALSVLNEIQANREKNGQADIFTGGAGNDSHKNYVVQTGQQIEFTAEEIQKLYNALGVTLKDGKSPQPAQETTDGTQTGQTEQTGGKQTPPKSVTPKNLRKTDCPGVFYDEATKTHYKIEGGKYVEFKGKHGGKVIQVNKDGSYFERLEKDENGNYWTDYVGANGKNVSSKQYDKKGNMISNAVFDQKFNDKFSKRIDYVNGKAFSTSEFKYNSDGSYTQKYFKHNIGWKHPQIMYYNKEEQKTGGILKNGTTKYKCTYLQNGNRLETYTPKGRSPYYYMYTPDGKSYECDANGKPIN